MRFSLIMSGQISGGMDRKFGFLVKTDKDFYLNPFTKDVATS